MASIRVVNPATLEVEGEVPASTAADVERALAAARAAQPAWGARTLADRLRVVRAIGAAVLREREALAQLVTREMGKPSQEALAADVLPVLDSVKYVTGRGRRVLEPRAFRLHNPIVLDRTSRMVRTPLGVVGIIAPWNYPLGIPGSEVVFALAAGNAVVLKPASATPLVALRFAQLARAAGLPDGLLHVLPGSGSTVGRAMTEAPFDHLIFTGSDDVGRTVEASCAARGVACTLELGGSDPAIVLEDANLELAANGIVWARFTNAGQTCAAAKRAIVVEAVADEFASLVTEKVRRLRVGNGLDPATDVGPLVDAKAVAEMEAFVADATKRGGKLLVGGNRRKDLPGHFFEPTVLLDVPRDARALREEVFGPVLPIVRVRDEAEAVALANDTRFGLTASVWTRDAKRARAVAARLDAGTVTVNDHTYTFAMTETPWAGVKASGRGATHGEEGLLALTRTKHVNVAPSRRLWPNLWWYPYGPREAGTWRLGLPFLYGSGLRRFLSAPRIVAGVLRKKLL